MSTINLNQFALQQEIGSVDLTFFGGENIMSVMWDPTATSTLTLVPGELVQLVDLGASDVAGVPIIGKRAADTDPIFGAVVRQTRLATYSPGDKLEIAIIGAPMWFYSTLALTRGEQVSGDVANPGYITAVSTNKLLGITLDKIAATGLGRVLIQATGA